MAPTTEKSRRPLTFLAWESPWPSLCGGDLRTIGLLGQLHRWYDVHLMVFSGKPLEPAQRRELGRHAATVTNVRLRNQGLRDLLANLLTMLRRRCPYHCAVAYRSVALDSASARRVWDSPDPVYASYGQWGTLALEKHTNPWILDQHNADIHFWAVYAANAGAGLMGLAARINGRLARLHYPAIYRRVEKIVSVCEEDRILTAAWCSAGKVHVVENGVDCSRLVPGDRSARSGEMLSPQFSRPAQDFSAAPWALKEPLPGDSGHPASSLQSQKPRSVHSEYPAVPPLPQEPHSEGPERYSGLLGSQEASAENCGYADSALEGLERWLESSERPSAAPEAAPQPAARLLFTGTSHPRNMTALKWFVQEVFPKILSAAPDTELVVGGDFSEKSRLEFQHVPRVSFTGRVPDMRPVFRSADLFIAPFRETHGSKLKIAEAMAMGMCIVSTPEGARGFQLKDGESVAIAPDSAEFAKLVVALLGDPARRKQIGENARGVALETIDWNTLGVRLHAIVESAAGPAASPAPRQHSAAA